MQRRRKHVFQVLVRRRREEEALKEVSSQKPNKNANLHLQVSFIVSICVTAHQQASLSEFVSASHHKRACIKGFDRSHQEFVLAGAS